MNNYLCDKCDTLIEGSAHQPSQFHCPGGGSHHWTSLGEVGDTTYQCSKCSNVVHSRHQPSQFHCPAGSSHHWSRL